MIFAVVDWVCVDFHRQKYAICWLINTGLAIMKRKKRSEGNLWNVLVFLNIFYLVSKKFMKFGSMNCIMCFLINGSLYNPFQLLLLKMKPDRRFQNEGLATISIVNMMANILSHNEVTPAYLLTESHCCRNVMNSRPNQSSVWELHNHNQYFSITCSSFNILDAYAILVHHACVVSVTKPFVLSCKRQKALRSEECVSNGQLFVHRKK